MARTASPSSKPKWSMSRRWMSRASFSVPGSGDELPLHGTPALGYLAICSTADSASGRPDTQLGGLPFPAQSHG